MALLMHAVFWGGGSGAVCTRVFSSLTLLLCAQRFFQFVAQCSGFFQFDCCAVFRVFPV